MPGKPPKKRRETRISYIDEEGNRQTYIGDPKAFKLPKIPREPIAKIPREPIERKGGGIALRGGGRAFYKGGKV